MNWLDILILAVILVFALLGLKRGLINEAVSILALVLGIIAGVMFYDYVGRLFVDYNLVENRAIGSIGGFIVVTFGIYVSIQLLGWVISKIIGTLHLNWADRIGGGAFGVIKGIVLSFVLIWLLGFFFAEKEPPLKNSILVPYVNEAFSALKEVFPDDLREKLQQARKLIREKGIEAAVKVGEAERIKEFFEGDEKK